MRERIEDILDRIQDVLADMTPRDRSLLLGLTIVVLVAISWAIAIAVVGSMDRFGSMSGNVSTTAALICASSASRLFVSWT